MPRFIPCPEPSSEVGGGEGGRGKLVGHPVLFSTPRGWPHNDSRMIAPCPPFRRPALVPQRAPLRAAATAPPGQSPILFAAKGQETARIQYTGIGIRALDPSARSVQNASMSRWPASCRRANAQAGWPACLRTSSGGELPPGHLHTRRQPNPLRSGWPIMGMGVLMTHGSGWSRPASGDISRAPHEEESGNMDVHRAATVMGSVVAARRARDAPHMDAGEGQASDDARRPAGARTRPARLLQRWDRQLVVNGSCPPYHGRAVATMIAPRTFFTWSRVPPLRPLPPFVPAGLHVSPLGRLPAVSAFGRTPLDGPIYAQPYLGAEAGSAGAGRQTAHARAPPPPPVLVVALAAREAGRTAGHGVRDTMGRNVSIYARMGRGRELWWLPATPPTVSVVDHGRIVSTCG